MKKIFALFLAVIMVLSLCACGASSDSAASTAAYSTEAYYETDTVMAAETAGADGYSVGTSNSGSSSASDSAVNSGFDSEKIIYSCYAEIETQDFEQSCADVAKLIERCGGFLESSSVRGTDYYADGHRSADYVIRVPRACFEEVTQNLSTLGNVPYSSISAENISADYRDTESRLTAYQVEEERLLTMLEMADTVEDMLNIEDRLADVRYNIESLTTTLQGWDSLVNYSTLTLNIEEVTTYTEAPEPNYWQRLSSGFVQTLHGLGNFFEEFFLVLVALLPVLVVLAVVAAVVIVIVRSSRKRKAKKRAAKVAAPTVTGEKPDSETK